MKLFKKPVHDDLLSEEVKSDSKLFSLLTNKKVVIPVGIVVLIVVLLVIKGVLGSNSSDLNYYDTMTSIFSNELGSFKYTFDVRTGEKGSLISEVTNVDSSVGELNEVENADSTEGQEVIEKDDIAKQDGTKEQKNEFQSWDKYADIKVADWQYPNYQITIEGCTMSLEPLKTDFTISLATESYNSKFTEVVVMDGNYYIDVESMYNWYKNSGDSYLMSIGLSLPNGSKWLVIDEKDFRVPSSYAEEGEKELSEATSLKEMYQRFLVALLTSESTIKNAMGTTGMQTGADTVNLNLNGDSAVTLLKTIKGVADKSGDFYSSVIAGGKEKGLYTEDQYKQAIREKDNFIEAISPLNLILNTTDLSATGLKVSGFARKYTNSSGNMAIEGTLGYQFSSETTDHIVKVTGFRSGDTKDIELPSGSQMKEDMQMFVDAINSSVAYFNTTVVKTSVQLDINPTTISEDILEKFITLVNDAGTAGYYVTRNNVFEFIEKYSNYKENDDTTNGDLVNAKLVQDLAESLNKIVGGIVVEKEVVAEEEVEQYPDIIIDDASGYVSIKYNTEESDAKLIVLDMEVINKSDDTERTFTLTDYSLRTLLNSVYPANNETLLRNYDNTFDMEKLQTEMVLQPHEWGTCKLYFVISDDTGHMDLYSGDNKINTVVQY